MIINNYNNLRVRVSDTNIHIKEQIDKFLLKFSLPFENSLVKFEINNSP